MKGGFPLPNQTYKEFEMRRVLLTLMAILVLGSTLVADTYACNVTSAKNLATGKVVKVKDDVKIGYGEIKGKPVAVLLPDGSVYELDTSKTKTLNNGVIVSYTSDSAIAISIHPSGYVQIGEWQYTDGGWWISWRSGECTRIK